VQVIDWKDCSPKWPVLIETLNPAHPLSPQCYDTVNLLSVGKASDLYEVSWATGWSVSAGTSSLSYRLRARTIWQDLQKW